MNMSRANDTTREAIRALPGFGEIPRQPRESRLLPDWMNEHEAVVDQSDWVAFSMHHGTVTYKGTIQLDTGTASLLTPSVREHWATAGPNEPLAPDGRMAAAAYWRSQSK